MKKCLIVAVGQNYEIGVKGALPWHIPSDLQYFKMTTLGCPVIMGRTTYFSIGRPLPGRKNIVLNLGGDPIDGVTCVYSFEEAYREAEATGAEKCFIIGGASVYKAAMPEMDLLYITRVHKDVPGADAFFPEIKPAQWHLDSTTPAEDEASGFKLDFEVYSPAKNMITKELWGTAPDGKEIFLYTLKNASGAYVKLSSVGAGIVSIVVPDKDGKLDDVVIGYKNALDYFADGPCSGKIPGRFANRIAKGHFTLDGTEYTLPINNGPNHLHGGPEGFQNKVWDSRIDGDAVEFMYFAEDGEAGYPGALKAVAHYTWGDDNSLKLVLTAEADRPTVVNLTNHVYFNLDGEGSGSVLDHVLELNASQYLPTDETLIPLGEPEDVAGTPMDFVEAKPIGRDINADFPALKYGKGYDNCYLIDGYIPGQLATAAELWAAKSGRHLEVLTTQPAVQIYTGNWLKGCPMGKSGRAYEDYDGVAIECQHCPDSPNRPEYPSTVLRPGEVYEEAIIFAFDA